MKYILLYFIGLQTKLLPVVFHFFLAQLSTEARVDIGFNPLKLFSDASVNSCLVESSTASASTHDTNQVSLKWKGSSDVIFLTVTKLNISVGIWG